MTRIEIEHRAYLEILRDRITPELTFNSQFQRAGECMTSRDGRIGNVHTHQTHARFETFYRPLNIPCELQNVIRGTDSAGERRNAVVQCTGLNRGPPAKRFVVPVE